MGGGTGNTCCSIHLIDENGTFNAPGIQNFAKEVELAECGLNYAIVSIMGPQNSGKSTLLNHLFDTDFREMDALKERCQTTKGIWFAKSPTIEPCTLVMDLEGTDGREREANISFELQSALFALAVSDILLINMWCHDLGRVQAANMPLLRVVFQVMNQLFGSHKVTLLFVLRDKTRTPMDIVEPLLRKDIQKIWDSFDKPEAHRDTPLSEFFNVEVVALSNYEEQEDQFKEQVASLRQRLLGSVLSGRLTGCGRDKVPASGFPFSVQEIWKTVNENRDLNLPSHKEKPESFTKRKVMVATVRCEEIATEKLSSFSADEDWCQLEAAVQCHPVEGFGNKLSLILDNYLLEYDKDTRYFDEGIRIEKRKHLTDRLLQLVEPAYELILECMQARTLEKFKEEFDRTLNEGERFSVAVHDCTKFFIAQFEEGCTDALVKQANWNSSRICDELRRGIEMYVEALRSSKLSELCSLYEKELARALSLKVDALLVRAVDDTWVEIRNCYRHEIESAVSDFSIAVSGLGVDEQTKNAMFVKLENYARGVVEDKARQDAKRVLAHLMQRFVEVFSHDFHAKPRVWSGKENIQEMADSAYSVSLKLLTALAVIRLDGDFDNIGKTLSLALLSRSTNSDDLLLSSFWEEVPESQTLLTPIQCKSFWMEFKEYAEHIVIDAQEAQRQAGKNWSSFSVAASTVGGIIAGGVIGVLAPVDGIIAGAVIGALAPVGAAAVFVAQAYMKSKRFG